MTKSPHEIRAGDRVRFRNRRGKTVAGTVNRVRVRHRKGRVREVAEMMTGNPHSLDYTVAEVAADDGGVWTVPLGSVEYTGAGDTREAANRAANVRSARADHEADRRSNNYEAASETNLLDVKVGDEVEVKFRDRSYWTRVKFLGFVSGSGNVRFEYFGRKRTTPAKFVRPVAPE